MSGTWGAETEEEQWTGSEGRLLTTEKTCFWFR